MTVSIGSLARHVAAAVGIAVLLLVFDSSASGHHGNAEYDLSLVIRYEGVVIEHRWRNPHTLTRLATRTPSGQSITLDIEGGPPAVLRPAGVDAKSIVKGERVTAVVSPSRRFPEQSAYGHEIIKANGTVIPLDAPRAQRSGAQTARRAAGDIFGTWLPRAESFAQMRGWARSWVLTPKGQGIRARFSPAMHRHAQCEAMSAPMLMTYPVGVRFERLRDRVLITTDWLGATRSVYLDRRDHPAPPERHLQGHSLGRWEGKVLVVDTRNFADEVWAGLPSGEGKHLVERFALSDDGRSLRYSFMLNDPEYLAGPVRGGGQMDYRPDLPIGGVDCDRDLAARFLRELR